MFVSISVAVAMLFQAPSIVTRPQWLVTPTPEQFQDHYPRRAWREDVEGKATLQCRVGVDTLLHDCQVLEETPAGFGFGEAAVAMSAEMRMSPRTIDGRPDGGAVVRVPIVFKLPEEDFAIPDLDEALRCFVGLTDRRTDAPEAARTSEISFLWVVIQAHGLDQQLDAAAIQARIQATREAMARGEIDADWCV